MGQAPNPRDILRQAGLTAKKSWGQNFLCDARVLGDIAAATEAGPGQPVLELGAGLGALTYHLVHRGGAVVAIERDRDLLPLLSAALGNPKNLDVRAANAAQLDYAALAAEFGQAVNIAGNLPYQLSSRILVAVADAHEHVQRGVFLVQREVGQRLAAPSGSRTYGLLSVLVQRHMNVELLRAVPPGAFHPPPKVHSVVVRMTPHHLGLGGVADHHYVRTARAAFSARRKTLRNALKGGLQQPAAEIEKAIIEAGVLPEARAETLDRDAFVRLARSLAHFFAS